ncbi:phage major capsid protein [Streptomyces sp. NPDC048306]|uniref:phage major capsid protein n=1 Tax=Streptomyces sp. NPDC048306 TaxID=3154502 RepID=UPI0033F8C292
MTKKKTDDDRDEPAFERARDLTAARERVTQIHEEMGVIDQEAGGEDLDEAAQRSWDDLEAELKFREGEVRALERSERLRASRDRWSSTQFSPQNDPFADDPRTLSGRAVYDRSMAVVDSSAGGRHLRDDQKEQVQHVLRTQTGDTNGELVGRLLLATENPHYRSAFQKIAASQTPIFTPEESRAVEQVQLIKRAMSIGVDASGGFAVPVLIDPTIILTAQGSENDILRLARVETITNDTWRGLSSAGVSWSFKAEAAPAGDNSPTIAQPEVATHRADGFIPFSIEIGMDWPGFAEQMSGLLAEGYDELLAEKLTTGSAADEPDGLIASLAAQSSPAPIETATSGAIAAGDIYGLWNALPQKYRRRASAAWLSSTDVQNTIRQLGTTDPNFTVDITQEAIPRLFGKEYPMNDFMADLPAGAGSEALLAVGDFKGYLVAQRAGMTVEFIPQLFDTTNNRPTGQRGWFAWARVGAGVVNPQAFRLLVNNDGV